jgi:CHASE3 domain sensor protein
VTALVLRFVLPMTILAVMAGAVFFYITSAEWAKRELDDAKTHIENRERIDDALSADRDCPWLDRLRASCP